MAEIKKFPKGLIERFVPSLLVVTVGLAFLVGVLWEKVKNLEGGGIKPKTVANDNSGNQPEDAGSIDSLPGEGKLSESQARKVPGINEEDRIRGSSNPEVYLIEYSDLECPFCKQFHKTAKQAVSDYKGKLAWVYRHFPLDNLHPKADKEAEASECARELGGDDGFWNFTDKVFEVTPSNNGLDLAELSRIAGEVGLDKNNFQTCLDSGKYKDLVEAQYQGGVTAGVSGTPGNFIVNKKGEVWVIPGAVPLETLKKTVDIALEARS